MADDQDASNDLNENENDEGGENFDYEDASASATSSASVVQNTTAAAFDDYNDDDEPIEDYVVNLVVNERPDIVNTFVTDSYGNTIYNTLNGLTTSAYDELNSNGTALTGGKRWFGWSTTKLIFAILIALCILGIILAVVFFVVSKKFKKNPRTATAAPASSTGTKTVVGKSVSPDPKYQPVPNV